MTPLTTRMHCWPSKLQESHKYVTKQKERYLAAVDKALAVSAKKTALALELDQDTTDERRLWMRTALVRVWSARAQHAGVEQGPSGIEIFRGIGKQWAVFRFVATMWFYFPLHSAREASKLFHLFTVPSHASLYPQPMHLNAACISSSQN